MNATLQATAQAAAPHIAHVHIHGFFAAVEQALRPRLRGKPVLVGRNTVISASYEAKLSGITSAMPMEQALAVCPTAVVVPARHERYAEYSERLHTILETFTPAVDSEANHGFYLNFFGSTHLQGDFPGTVRRLQLEVLKHTGLSVSIGAAKSKIAAAVASRLERPGSVRIIAPGTEGSYMSSLPVEALDGADSISVRELRGRGIVSIAELRRVPLPSLEIAFGPAIGREIWHHARGLDVRPKPIRPGASPLRPWPMQSWLAGLFSDIASSFLGAKALSTSSS
jgi:DNA polymerase-4